MPNCVKCSSVVKVNIIFLQKESTICHELYHIFNSIVLEDMRK